MVGRIHLCRPGQRTAAQKVIDELKELSASVTSPYGFAQIYAGLGDQDQAFAWLERDIMIAIHCWIISTSIRLLWPGADPRYANLARRMGFAP